MRNFAFSGGALSVGALAVFVVVAGASVARADCDPTPGGGWHRHPGAGAGAMPGCVTLNTGLGGAAGFGTFSLPGNDDGSTPVVNLMPAFGATGLNFFGGPFHQVYINNNGNMTFGGTLFTYTPTAFPLGTGSGVMYPMIAPYWADIDTRNGVMAGGANLLYWDMRAGQMTVTWFDVGYYSSHIDRRMSFQMILRNATSCGSGDFDVEFRYNRCEWTAGDVSGGTGGLGGSTQAQVGFDAHDGRNYVSLPMSLGMGILNVCTTSNVGMPGIYQFGVRGGSIVCPGTGSSCTVSGRTGACALGITACSGMAVTCMPIGSSSAERCDNIDNDCNGMTDDGMNLCPPTEACVNGTCVPVCFEGSCPMGETCMSGQCVDTACVGVTCMPGQRCVGGTCIDGCSGVTCPHGTQCAAGRCIDLCNVLMCDAMSVCQDGMCIAMCPCHACTGTDVCGADGRCTPTGCDVLTCSAGQYCAAGACQDACTNADGMGNPAVCPPNQHCEVGECVDNPPPTDAGIPVGTDAGIPPGTDGGHGIDASGGADGGRGPHRTGGGCGCRVDRRGSAAGWLGAIAIGLLLAQRRRRWGAR